MIIETMGVCGSNAIAVSAWRRARDGQPDIDGRYVPRSGDVSEICGATEDEADEIARHVDITYPT
jgi:hypothetical protein